MDERECILRCSLRLYKSSFRSLELDNVGLLAVQDAKREQDDASTVHDVFDNHEFLFG
jgi:hypothetical protein